MSDAAETTLAQWLAGEFDNRPQSLENPAWFVHLRLWHRPLPHKIDGNIAIFAEQANALYLDKPYRQRMLVLQPHAAELRVQYLAFKQPDRFRGAGANPERLESVTAAELEHLSGCWLSVTRQSDRFLAQPQPDVNCYFQYEGQTRQVVLGFEVSIDRFWSHDRGVDPDTGQSLWGATMGAYEFQKQTDFALLA